MVRTGKRAEVLKSILLNAGLKEGGAVPAPPRLADLPAPLADEVVGLYRALGGIEDVPTLRPGSWDLVFAGPLVVELDEGLHFNRYRALTLSASWARGLPWTEEYRAYCDAHEDDCLSAGTWGKRWTNPSCERMFGSPEAPGDLTGPGAPRWKQRALYDGIKDVTASTDLRVSLARISVHDTVGGARIGELLNGSASADPVAILALVEARTA